MSTITNQYEEILQLRAQLAEAQMETKKHRANAQAALNQLQSQAAQLAEARELEVQMTATGARANLALIKERDALSAQLAGMREVLKYVYARVPYTDPIFEKVAQALATSASEWEKRVQGLVDLVRMGLTEDTSDGFDTLLAEALAAWEGK